MRGPEIIDIMGAQPVAVAALGRPRPKKLSDREVHQARLRELGRRTKAERARTGEAKRRSSEARRRADRASPEQKPALEQEALAAEREATLSEARLAQLAAEYEARLVELGPPYPAPYPHPYAPPPYPYWGAAPDGYEAPGGFVPMPVPELPEPLPELVSDPLAEKMAGDPRPWRSSPTQSAAPGEKMAGEPEDLQGEEESRLRAALPPMAPDEREVFHAMYRGALITIARQRGGFRGSVVIELRPGLAPIVVSVLLPLELVRGLYERMRERGEVLRRYIGSMSTERIGADDVRRAFEDLGRDETFREVTKRVDEVLQHPAVRAVTNAIPFVSQIADAARVASGAARGLGEGGVDGMGRGALRGLGSTQVAALASPAPGFELRAGLHGGRAAELVPVSQRRAAHELAHLLAVRDPGAVAVTLELAGSAADGDPGALRALGLVRAAKRGAFRRVEIVERVGANPENPWQASGLYR